MGVGSRVGRGWSGCIGPQRNWVDGGGDDIAVAPFHPKPPGGRGRTRTDTTFTSFSIATRCTVETQSGNWPRDCTFISTSSRQI
jgi:hypothetical protein